MPYTAVNTGSTFIFVCFQLVRLWRLSPHYMRLRTFIAYSIVIISSFIYQPLLAQTGGSQDLSTVRVDELTDAQVRKFMQQFQATGMGDDQIEQMAAARGMQPEEVQKLRIRIERLKRQPQAGSNNNTKPSKQGGRTVSGNETRDINTEETFEDEELVYEDTLNRKIFGAQLFANSNPTFEPNLRLATPIDYQLGPDDEILIDIYGYSEASYQLTVSPDGNINIPMVGVVPVSGATIEQATSRIRTRLTRIYPGINNGSTSVAISLGNIRSIRVTLTGELKRPGTYTLPSVATVFNALYASGGPTNSGSFRTIQIIRGTDVVGTLDVYDFLLYGTLKNNIRLQDQDVIRVPTYRSRVEVSGEVKRPGIFEMKGGEENLNDLLRFAGDFTENAYRARVKVLKNTATEREIQDVTADKFETYTPQSGDQYFVDRILERFTNRVQIGGAVYRPGPFELEQGLSLSGLIRKAEGVREDAFLNRGYITRRKPDLTTEVISFNVSDILSGRANDIILRRDDEISISSIFDLREEYKLSIDGEVRRPGTFKYAENTSLEELIIQAGGFTESATPKRVEISRRIRNTDATKDTAITAQVFTVDVSRDLSTATSGFKLEPFDIVSVRSAPGYEAQRNVRIEGEVLYPGTYTIVNKNERISDLIKRAGGLTFYAYEEGASLKRIGNIKTQSDVEQENIKVQQFQELQKSVDDSTKVDVAKVTTRNDYVGIDLERILDRPGRRYDLLLEDGDVLNVPKQLQTVKVSGEVLSPSSVIYTSSGSFKDYIRQSGGFGGRALKRRAYVVYANGSIASTRKFLFFNNFPDVKPGAEIYVPRKEERKGGIGTSEIVAISTGLATIAALIFTIVR